MRRTHVAFVLAVAAAAPAWAQQEPADRAAVTSQLGREPIYCAATLADRQLCTWRENRTFHLVCEFDASGKRTSTPCVRKPDNESMTTFPGAVLNRPGGPGTSSRARLHEAARAQLDAARSLAQVVELVGAGPVWCQRRDDAMTCSWHLVRRTPGYIEVARVAEVSGKKLNLRCVFAADGSSRADGSCTAAVGGRAESPPG